MTIAALTAPRSRAGFAETHAGDSVFRLWAVWNRYVARLLSAAVIAGVMCAEPLKCVRTAERCADG